jgi:hypothetical protein
VLAVVEPFVTFGSEMFVALPPELESDRREEARADVARELAEVLPAGAADGCRSTR